MEGEGGLLKELVAKSNENSDGTLDHVIKDIFVSCDGESAGTVETSKLIEFIVPFLQADATAAAELKKFLDPDDSNPMIDIETFRNRMKEWTLKMSGTESEDLHNLTPRDSLRLTEADLSFVQSTPRSSFGHHLLKGYVDSVIMNTSGCSTYSLGDFVTPKAHERTALEEHVQEVEYQKKRMAEELSRVKAELAGSLETNENLQGILDRTLKKLGSEQKLIEQLQNERRREEENEAELSDAKRRVVRMEKAVSTAEKRIAELTGDLRKTQDENQKLEEKNARTAQKSREALQEVVALQTEIEVWRQKFAAAEVVNGTLKEENQSLQDVIENCGCEIDKLTFEKIAMEKILKTASPSFLPRAVRSSSFSEYSPTVRDLLRKHTFSTPKTLANLLNPISPIFSPEAEEKESTPESCTAAGAPPDPSIDFASPPIMYIVDRTPDDALTQQQQQIRNESKESENGDDLPAALQFMAANASTAESLQEEMSKATFEEDPCPSGQECPYRLKCLTLERELSNVQSETTDRIERQSTEIEELTKDIQDHEFKTSQLSNEISDLKAQLSLSLNKESTLSERKNLLEEALRSKEDQLTEISSRLSELQSLKSKDELVTELNSELEYLKEANEALNADVKDLAKIARELDEAKIGLKTKEVIISELLSEAALLREAKRDLNEHDLKNEAKIGELQREVDYKSEELKDATDRFEKLRKTNREMKDECQKIIDTLGGDVKALKEEIHGKSSKLTNLQLRTNSLLAENETLKELLGGKSENKPALKRSSFDKLNVRKERLEQKVQDLEEKLGIEREALAEVISQAGAFERELKESSAQNLTLRDRLEAAKDEIETLRSETRTVRDEDQEDQQHQLNELALKLEAEERERIATFSQLDQLKESLSQARFKLERYTLRVAASFKVPDGLLRKILTADSLAPQTPDCVLNIYKEVYRSREQVDITSNVLDYLATRRSKTASHSIASQTESANQRKPRSSTFTLRPATFIPEQCLGYDPAGSGDAEVTGAHGDEEPQDQVASPALSEDTLDDLGLLRTDLSLAQIPEGDLEDLYRRVAVAFASDGASAPKRYSNQEARLRLKQRLMTAELAACKKSLQEERRNAALERLESVFSSCTQVSASAELFGSLRHERRIGICTALMIRYAEHVKKRLESVEGRLRSIGLCVKPTSAELADFEPDVQVAKLQRCLPMESHIFPRPTSRAIQVATRCLLVWMAFVTVFCLLLLSALQWDGDSVYFSVPWPWKSFDDPWAPFVKKSYARGPPPT